jgi:hypothetical protein
MQKGAKQITFDRFISVFLKTIRTAGPPGEGGRAGEGTSSGRPPAVDQRWPLPVPSSSAGVGW